MTSCISNPSPPGAFSSGSSTHSHRRSPLDLESSSVDSLISSLLQAVTGETCGNCDEHSSSRNGAQAVARCQDCGEPLCEACVTAHRRVKRNKQTNKERIINTKIIFF